MSSKVEIPKKLQELLASLPLPEPTRIVESEDGAATIVEWQIGRDYYEIELEDGELSVMANKNGVFKHWLINAA